MGMVLMADGVNHLNDTDANILSSVNIKLPYSGSIELCSGFIYFFALLYCLNKKNAPNKNNEVISSESEQTIADTYLLGINKY